MLVPWQQQAVEREGRPVIQWYRKTMEQDYYVEEMVWTEPDTSRIVSKERKGIDPVTGQTIFLDTSENYRYNEGLPEGFFDAPPEMQVVQQDYAELEAGVWDRLSAKERVGIQTIIHRSEDAWQNANFAAFTAVWNFHVVDYLPLDTEWKQRLEAQAESGSHWHSEVEIAHRQDYIPITVTIRGPSKSGEGIFMWGLERRKVLHVKARLSVFWGEKMEWEGTTVYYVGRRGRGCRIVHWECPWEKIKEAQQAAKQSS